MKLTLLKGSHYSSTLPHPATYKCKIVRVIGSRSQVVTRVGPLHLLPVGWDEATRKPN